MQALQHAIYKAHLRRERARQEPYFDPMEDEWNHASPEEAERLSGFADPKNTVAVTVPLVGYDGGEYGARVEMISPEDAGKRIDGDRETIRHLREALAEQRFWRRFMARAAWALTVLNVLTLLFQIGG